MTEPRASTGRTVSAPIAARLDTPADFPDYDEWRRAFPELPWDGEPKNDSE